MKTFRSRHENGLYGMQSSRLVACDMNKSMHVCGVPCGRATTVQSLIMGHCTTRGIVLGVCAQQRLSFTCLETFIQIESFVQPLVLMQKTAEHHSTLDIRVILPHGNISPIQASLECCASAMHEYFSSHL